jgi:hypothetical protein
MGPELSHILGDLPVVGPFFTGGLPMIVLRIVGLVVGFIVGLKLLKHLLRGVGSAATSERALIKEERFEEVGDLHARKGDHAAALRNYEKAQAWVKAGHSARRLGDPVLAARHFQKGGAHKLAIAAREAAGINIGEGRPSAKSTPTPAPKRKTRKSAPQQPAHKDSPSPPVEPPGELGEPVAERRDEATSAPRQHPAASTAAHESDSLVIDADFNFVSFFSSRDSTPPLPATRDLGPTESCRLELESPLESVGVALAEERAPVLKDVGPCLEETVGVGDSQPDAAGYGATDLSPGPPSAEAERAVSSSRRRKRSKRNSEMPHAAFGRAVTDRYEIQEELGEGGMAEVFRARDITLGRIVALKFLSPELMGNEAAMQFFRREARAAAMLNHPSIVTIYDIGVIGGRPFISMEYVEGTDLATRVFEEGALPPSFAIGTGIQIARALEFAHDRNVVHRDIKPANVMLMRGGGIKILDFGLAKAIQSDKKKQSVVAGTPEYMSPEQLSGREVDGRTDIFAYGVMLYEVLTERLPFDGALRTRDILPPSAHVPDLSFEIDRIVLKCIALDPGERFQRAGELVNDLRTVRL